MQYIEPLAKLIAEFGKLPSVGQKTAARYAYALLNWSDEEIEKFSDAIKELKEKPQPQEGGGNGPDALHQRHQGAALSRRPGRQDQGR